MLKRIITAVVCLAIFIPVLIFSGKLPWLFVSVLTLLALIAIYEICGCIGVRRYFFISMPCYIFTLFMMLVPTYFLTAENPKNIRYIPILFCVAFLFILYTFSAAMLTRGNVRFSQAGELISAAIYIILGFLSIILLRYSPHGNYLYMLVFIGAWSTDSFAYFIGKKFGKHKLIPEVSPNKTVEGAIGGVAGCVIAYCVYGLILVKFFDTSVKFLPLVIMGLIIGVVDQIGDLIASYIKREQGIKDYGTIFPGHGGVMDRFDSILAIAPVIFGAVIIRAFGAVI